MVESQGTPKKFRTLWVVVYAALLLIAVVAFKQYRAVARKPTENQARLHEVSKALDLYYQDCKTFPSVEQGFAPLLEQPESEPVCKKWDGPYLEEEDLVDNKGRRFVYSRDEEFYTLELPN